MIICVTCIFFAGVAIGHVYGVTGLLLIGVIGFFMAAGCISFGVIADGKIKIPPVPPTNP